MSNILIETIVSTDDELRHRSIDSLLKQRDSEELLGLAWALEEFRKSTDNLYYRVRASLFLFVIFRHYLQTDQAVTQHGEIPFEGITAAYGRDFESSIAIYLGKIRAGHLDSTLCSAVADAYFKISFQYLLKQVKLSISQCDENRHLHTISGIDDYPFRVDPEMTTPDPLTGLYPVGMDAAPVRLDPSHSGWSDIFFLGMDFPEGARVINLSVDLKVHGSDNEILPPCECYCRYIEEPVLKLVSIDLKTSKSIDTIDELFNFGNDYLSLLKAGVVASGIIPPCFESREISLKEILEKLLKKNGGIEITTKVNGIPKGSRLAVSTTLLSTIVTRLMRFSGQISSSTGPINDMDRRIVASRAILGEWLGGSGGGWQDSGGLWPGIKVISGMLAQEGHPEYGISRGCLLPEHNVFSTNDIPEEIERRIVDSMVLVHGGISQDVGPILEMVTEKYLLKHETEWKARLRGIELFDEIVKALKAGNMRELGRLTTEDWDTSIQNVIPAVNNAFTEDLIQTVSNEFGSDYYGFLMLGGMSGGGMAFIINPEIKLDFMRRTAEIMQELKETYNYSYPFIIDPVLYDFRINHNGIVASILKGEEAVPPSLPPRSSQEDNATDSDMLMEDEIKTKNGFDAESHEHIRSELLSGEIGLRKNRLPSSTLIQDVPYGDILHYENEIADPACTNTGEEALRNNEVAVLTFSGGMGSRWTGGAAVVKPINPFVRINGKYRTFIECHLAKSRMTGRLFGSEVPHVFTTSYLTHEAIIRYMERSDYFDYKDFTYISPGRSIGRRVYPMERDLRFFWDEQLQQKMEDNVQKVQDDAHRALINWAKERGQGADYSENRPLMRFNPPGHWYEIPNMVKNGTLAQLLSDNPRIKHLLCHNIDTLGACLDPALLGTHIRSGRAMTFEVTPRRIEDSGGGLALINGRKRLIEGMALPNEQDEFKLSYYNTLTCWIDIDALLEIFCIDRQLLLDGRKNRNAEEEIVRAVRGIEKLMPTYVTIKNVKYIWGSGQEDVYPIAQFEKLWGDMTSLDNLNAGYVSVSRYRGMQLKEPAMLDIWMNDGSLEYMKGKCTF